MGTPVNWGSVTVKLKLLPKIWDNKVLAVLGSEMIESASATKLTEKVMFFEASHGDAVNCQREKYKWLLAGS